MARPSGGESKRLRELHHAATDLMAASDVATVYQTTVDTAKTVLGFDFCSIFVRGDDGFEVAASSHLETGLQISQQDGILKQTFRTGEPSMDQNIPDSRSTEPLKPEFGSGLSVPIGETAVLQTVSKQSEYYTDSDLELAGLLAIHAEAALEKVRSCELIRTQKNKIAELHATSTELESCQSREEVYDLMKEASQEILGFDWCTLYVMEGDDLVAVMTSEESPVTVGETPFENGQSKPRAVFETGESNLVDDVHAVAEGEPTPERPRTALQVPVGDIGVYHAAREGPAEFDQDDLELAELLAKCVAEAHDRIEAQEQLRAQKQELERKNKRLDHFASMVSHDLRNPLNVAKLRAELIVREQDNKHAKETSEALSRMETMINELLTLARAGQAIETTEQCGLANLAKSAWENVQTAESELDCRVGDETVQADPNRLSQVFENLFRNAIDHNETPLVVRVGMLDSGDGFYVEDNGEGIPDDERETIFEHGYTTNEAGSGLGLAIVSDIVEAHSWSIEPCEGTDGGARFEIHTA